MAPQDELIFDVGEGDFDERVIRASQKRAVVVDFWAPWCAPCRMLSPVLEEVIASLGGACVLAKVNVDEASGLAGRYGVQGIPSVKVFRQGEVVAEFVGARGERDVREMLSRLVPTEVDEIVASGRELADAGRFDEAEPLYREALAKQPDHPGAFLGLALAALARGDYEAAREAVSRVGPGAAEHAEAERILARLGFLGECAERGGMEGARKLLAAEPDDLDALYEFASCLAAEEDYSGALEHLMRIIECDKGFRDGAAKNAMLRIFEIVGKRSDLADEYRSRLARALY